MNRWLSSRLAAHTGVRQVELDAQAERASNAADRTIGTIWQRLLNILRQPLQPYEAQRRALDVLRELHPEVQGSLKDSFHRVADWGHKTAVQALTLTLPVPYMQVAYQRRMGNGSIASGQIYRTGRLTEASCTDGGTFSGRVYQPHDEKNISIGEEGGTEADRRLPISLLERSQGLVGLAVQFGQLVTTDYAAPVREPAVDPADARQVFSNLLFPPPSLSRVFEIIHAPVQGVTWTQRWLGATRLAEPHALASIIGSGFAEGMSQAEIARRLLPAVQGVRTTARRIARTESMRIAHAVQHDAHKHLGDLVVGYQVHATLDLVTRPEHAHRSGTIYYAEPKPGQLGYDAMPHPPLESNGEVAWNCLLPGGRVQGRFKKGFKANYSGEAIQLTTRGGTSVRVTPNHPVLTGQGFVAAASIAKGDNLVSYRPRLNKSADHENDTPPLVEDAFGSIKAFGRVVSHRPNVFEFHGDAARFDSDVEIVEAERELGLGGQASPSNGVGYVYLAGAGVKAVCEASPSFSFLGRHGFNPSSACFVRSSDLCFPLVGISDPTPFGLFGFGLATHDATMISQPDENSVSGYAQIIRQLLERFPGRVAAGDDFNRRQSFQPESSGLPRCPDRGAGGAEPYGHSGRANAHLAGQSWDGFPGEIAFDEVVDVKVFHYSGPVYDFETDVGYFTSNYTEESGSGNAHIILSNCRCWVSPVLTPLEGLENHPAFSTTATDKIIPDQAVYSDWFDKAPERQRRIAVGTRRYSIVADSLSQDLTAKLPNGQKVEFVAHPYANHQETVVMVDPRRLSAAWSENKSNYLPPEGLVGSSEIAGRREGFKQFLGKGKAIQSSRVSISPDGRISFDDGRHRFAVLRDQGIDRIAITVPAKEAETFRQRFGVGEQPKRERPSHEHFVDPEDGHLLTIAELRAESIEQRSERVAKVRAIMGENRRLTREVSRFGFVPGSR